VTATMLTFIFFVFVLRIEITDDPRKFKYSQKFINKNLYTGTIIQQG
jgi:hypothetical protein